MQLSSLSSSGYQKSIHILFWGVAVAAVSLAVLRQVFDPANKTRCESLLNHGSWLDPQRTQWQPKGCMLKTYDAKSTSKCVGGSRIVMLGDSIVRQLYYSVVKKLIPDANTNGDKHSDIIFKNETLGVSFEFYWDPFLNSTRALAMTSLSSTYTNDIDNSDISLDASQLQPEQSPSILLVGSGLWYLRYAETSGGLEEWQTKIRSLARRMSDPSKPSLGDNLFISPIPAVNTDKLDKERLKTLLPKDINEMNTFLRETIKDTPITVPFSWNLMTETAASATNDGLHYVERVMTAEADVLLNFLCNNQLPKVAPMAATCCYDYPANHWFQSLMLAIFLLWLPCGFIVQTYYRNHPASSYFPSIGILNAMAVMAGSVVYMYYSDRTSLFGKGNKMYSTPSFALLMALSIAAGCLTLKKAEKDQVFLNRDQTDEWKGWMQIVILIYHYVGASSVSAIYNPVRMLVASYLFMTGFGHFVFFYKKADFGFTRVASILTRLNLLTVLLTYTMDTTYLSYYFAPLVSFFYLIIYLMMYIGHSHNKNPAFILTKIAVTAILTAVFIQTPVILDTIFSFLHFFFGVTWSTTEWRFRLQLDVWIVFVGALFAYGFIKAQELAISAHPQWNAIRSTTIIASVIGLFGYFAFEVTITKFEYNHYHPYISWIPILSFVFLRNSTSALRNTTSTFYSFIGKCSLETFIGQFHMWLAGDTKGLLIISPWIEGPGAWTFNLVISSFIFVAIAHALSGATGELSDWLVTGREPKQAKGTLATTPYTLLTAAPLTSRERETSPGIPLAVKQTSVIKSPISPSAGTVGPTTLKELMENSLKAEKARELEVGGSSGSGSHNMHGSNDSGSRSISDHGNTKGSHASDKSTKKPEAVSLQIDTSDVTRVRPQVVVSASSPTSATFKSLWSQPFWKVTIFFGIIWVMNYFS
ncbi:hypothetical protein BGZ92_000597 [Podila epicladia]|nr:hypothetical protein BGZ92_000597 [Podila epicladia]